MNINHLNHIKLKNYHYELPENKIAKYPAQPRDSSKLLVYKNSHIIEDRFFNLAYYLPENSLLIFNNTKVIQARLLFTKNTGSTIEILLLEPYQSSYEQVFNQTKSVQWRCMVGNAKKWKYHEILTLTHENIQLQAKWIKKTRPELIIELSWTPPLKFEDILSHIGKIPLPPYMNRTPETKDAIDYQTIYAKQPGAVAAPTAGLHFTEKVFHNLHLHKIQWTDVTLHVGAGTFQPIKVDNLSEHNMHQEFCYISLNSLKKIYEFSDNLIAVGTTSLRVLESLYWLVLNKFMPFEQWYPYQHHAFLNYKEALIECINFLEKKQMNTLQFPTQLFIVPGYPFQSIKGLITNFHQPESTLILLVAAWLGEEWKKVYDYAIKNDFRFLSYGDSSLLIR